MKQSTRVIRAGRIFDTIADVGTIFMAVLYVLYVALLLIFDLGTAWLNYTMFGITGAYIAFFMVKIFSLNRILGRKMVNRTVRLSFRYSKWALKIINAVFVVLSIAATQYADNNIIAMVGVFVVGFSFLVSAMWAVVWFIVRRKFRDIKADWDNLTPAQKNKRVEIIISAVVRSLDEFAGVDIAKSVSRGAKSFDKITSPG